MTTLADFSVYLFQWGPHRPTVNELVGLARHAEKLGFYSATFPYHILLPDQSFFSTWDTRYNLDALVLAPIVARETTTLRIGYNSLVLPLLHPYIWAQHLATLDVVSQGRLIAGMAVGWARKEFDLVGANLKTRAKVTEEQMDIITRLWTEDTVTFQGQFYQLREASLDPRPAQKPHPPIWFGGGGAAISRAARYRADLLLMGNESPEEIELTYRPAIEAENHRWNANVRIGAFRYCIVEHDEHKVRSRFRPRLEEHVSRSVVRTTKHPPEVIAMMGNAEHCAAHIRDLLRVGVSHFKLDFNMHGEESIAFAMENMSRFAEEVVPLL